MIKIQSNLTKVSIMVIAFLIVLPNLPLKFTLQQSALSLIATSSFVLLLTSAIGVLKNEMGGYKPLAFLHYVLIIFLLYLLFQLLPMDKHLISILSPSIIDVWESDAYGLRGKSVLTADITGTIWFFISWFSYIVLFVMLLKLIQFKWQFVFITCVLFLLGIYQILFDEISKFLGYEYISASQTDGHSYRLTGTFVNSNNISAVINLSLAAGLTLLILVADRIKQNKTFLQLCMAVLIIAGELLLLYGCIKAGSAGGLLSLISAAVLVSILLVIRKFSIRVLFILVLFLLSIIFVITFFGSRELNIIELTQNVSLSGRPVLWMDVLNMWKDFPVFGVGAGSFEWMFVDYKSDGVSPLRVFTAHSGYLHLLVELGLVGMAILLAFLIACLIVIIPLFKHSGLNVYLLASLMLGVIAFSIQEVVETNLLIPAAAMPFFACLALCIILKKPEFQSTFGQAK